MSLPAKCQEDPYFKKIVELLNSAKNDPELFEAIVNAPFHDKAKTTMIDLGVIVLLLVNKKTKTIDRIALSDTYSAAGAVRMSEKPFHEIKIPVGYRTNIIAKAIKENKPQQTTDWRYLFEPAMEPEAARFNQAGAGVECSYVYPLQARDGGALIYSYFASKKGDDSAEHHEFMDCYAQLASEILS